jgi:hypothetical protein
LVIDKLHEGPPDPNAAVLFVYLNYKEKLQAEELMASLIAQLINQTAKLPDNLIDEYEQYVKDQRHRLAENRIMEIFTSCVLMFAKVFLVLDAFDEATLELRQALIQEYFQRFVKLKLQVFITVRPQHADPIKAGVVASSELWISAKENDIEMYLKKELKPHRLYQELEDDILDTLKAKAVGKSHLRILEAHSLDFDLWNSS